MKLEEAVKRVHDFKSGSLTDRLSKLESIFQGLGAKQTKNLCDTNKLDSNLLSASFELKKLTAQIDVIIHSIGILLTLPNILHHDEIIETLSLGAGNTGKDFDLLTNRRIAEFKFIQWQGGSESIRQNSIFKDFFYLAEEDTLKSRYLYLLETERPFRFFNGKRKLSSVLSRNVRLGNEFSEKYGDRFSIVKEYFEYRCSLVEIVDLRDLVPDLSEILLNF